MLHAYSEPPGILSCHRYPVGSLLSFRWRALVSSGHALQGQTCQDLATYNIKHSFSQRKPGLSPKLPDRFFWTLHSAIPTGHFFDPVGSFSCFFLIIFFKGKKQPKSKKKKILLSKSTMLYKTCKFSHWLNLLSRFAQKAKLAPIKEKCKTSCGHAHN